MNLLSLDGGGVRGIISARILKEIIDRASVKINKNLHVADLFDFFGGSSIGTVIISGLLVPDPVNPKCPKHNIDQIIAQLKEQSPKLFQVEYFQNLRSLWGFRLPKYYNDNRVPFFSDFFGEILFEDLLKPVIFPCGDVVSYHPIYFQNTNPEHQKIKVIDILLGTTAAPTYFPSKELTIDNKKMDLIDSACVTNDTGQLTFVEALSYYNQEYPISKLYELSIGTGQTTSSYNSQWWGVIHWMPIIAGTLMDFNSQNQDYVLSRAVPKDQHDRINPPLPSNLDGLDYPQYIPQYLEITQKWIDENSNTIDQIVEKLLRNKEFII